MSLLDNEFDKISKQLTQSSQKITSGTTNEDFSQLLTQTQQALSAQTPTTLSQPKTDPLFPIDSPLNSALSSLTSTIQEKTLSLQLKGERQNILNTQLEKTTSPTLTPVEIHTIYSSISKELAPLIQEIYQNRRSPTPAYYDALTYASPLLEGLYNLAMTHAHPDALDELKRYQKKFKKNHTLYQTITQLLHKK
jgi:hypothetical protein